jgi:DNA-binding NarL/FixJ family response regulator
MATRLLIADGQELARIGLRQFAIEAGIEVAGEAATGCEAVEQSLAVTADVLLLAAEIKQPDAPATLAELKRLKPLMPVVVTANRDNPVVAGRMRAAGAVGFVVKDASREAFVRAVITAADGGRLWTQTDLRRQGAATATCSPRSPIEVSLTPREMEVLAGVIAGKTNVQIAAEHQLSSETVKEHIQHMLRKLGVADRTQAAVWAVRNGLA